VAAPLKKLKRSRNRRSGQTATLEADWVIRYSPGMREVSAAQDSLDLLPANATRRRSSNRDSSKTARTIRRDSARSSRDLGTEAKLRNSVYSLRRAR